MSTITLEDARRQLSAAIEEKAMAIKEIKEALSSQQVIEEGVFGSNFVQENEILKPPYDPTRLIKIVEDSSILPQCIDAMVHNTDGFGYQFFYTGGEDKEDSKEVLAEKKNLELFFHKVNELESFITVRKSMRKDLETTGNGYMELIRTATKDIGLIYHADARYMRLQKKQSKEVEINVKMYRNGKEAIIKVRKRFRRFCMVTNTRKKKYKWFKEYGDPRDMNADTGKYAGEDGYTKNNPASEILHFKLGNGTYGIPRWVGNVVTALGLHSADYVNYDLFENQVVPPLAILVSGGKLTVEAVQDIKNILLQKKGTENFNKVLILEAITEGDISDKSNTKIELKEMSSARKEDSMFTQYVDSGEHRIRGSFRLPPLYLGRADSYSKSTADSSKMVAEEQVFVPERMLFDEFINLTLMEEIGAKYHEYKSKGPRLITGEQIIDGFKEFGKLGVFTINEGIRLANRTLGLDITLYKEEWANYPVAIVVELARMGQLAGIEEISNAASGITDLLDGASDDFDNPDNAQTFKAYNALLAMQKNLKKYIDNRVEKDELDDLRGLKPTVLGVQEDIVEPHLVS